MGPRRQTIYRVAKQGKPYSQLCNAMLRDARLSLEARGLLVFILSHPLDWEFDVNWLMKEASVGRDRAKRLIAELIECGHCTRTRDRNPDGTLAPYVYEFADEPRGEPAEATSDWIPVTGEPPPENPLRTNKEITKQNPKDQRANARSSESRIDDDGKGRPAQRERFVSEAALDRVRDVAPGWDRQYLHSKFLDWPGSQNARDMDGAFLGWVRSFTKGRRPEAA